MIDRSVPYFSIQRVAQELVVSQDDVRRMIEEGELETININKRKFVTADSLDRFVSCPPVDIRIDFNV